jgi:DNA-binding NtrC family response regulator/tetratricopeptide (TPR) repeat protein
VQLLADRFVMGDRQQAVDLATGRDVIVTLCSSGGEREQRQWALRCDVLQKLHHPSIARLIDYGSVGESQRFEAWESSVAINSGSLWSSLDVARLADPSSHVGGSLDLPVEECGILKIERQAVAVLRELLEPSDDLRPRIAALWGPNGAGKHTALLDLARIARLHGFVPLSASLASAFGQRLAGRSLLLIDSSNQNLGWSALLDASLRTPRPHVLVFVGRDEIRGVDGVRLAPLPTEALVAAVCPPVGNAEQASIRRMAAQAQGWPGRFSRLLWHGYRPPQTKQPLRAAEQVASYGINNGPIAPSRNESPPISIDELAIFRHRLTASARMIASGRHAPGERKLRQAIGALSRRRDWSHAADGSLLLASLLVRRGRLREAQAVLDRARDGLNMAGDNPRLFDVAIQKGQVSIELARLEDAETILGTAIATACSVRDEDRRTRAASALARALFWRGKYDEAEEMVRSLGRDVVGDRPSITALALGSRVAVGQKALDLAVTWATEALERAERSGEAQLLADAGYAAAFAHLAVGDIAAVERDVVLCVSAARSAHDPLLAVRCRLLLVEALRRTGRLAPALALLHRIGKVAPTLLPPIVRSRFELMRDVVAATTSIDEIVSCHAARSGLPALALFVRSTESRRGIDNTDSVLDDVVELFNLCQTSGDESTILLEVCRRIRSRIHATAVGFTVVENGKSCFFTSDGNRLEMAIVDRAIRAETTIGPHRHEDRIEAAVPIRYGGTILGAFAARWTVGIAHDLSRIGPMLGAVAAATAPVLWAAVAQRRQASMTTLKELLGTSTAMTEVRRAIDRAASAPFAVLIEGESGSGKELVARAVHRSGSRRDRPFCSLNCAALPDELIESELFGHARGAFTGAVGERPGVFEEAHGGTLFLDEIGELSPRAQAKMLRVLQDGELRRIGENAARRIDVRVVSATNRDLRQEAAAGRFRFDLLYRLDVIRIVVPPLRDRREDVAVLTEHFWRDLTARMGSRAALSAATLGALARYDWPGNVRELQNVLAALVVRSAKRGVVPPTALGPQFGEPPLADAMRLEDARRTFEERFVRAALVRTGGHRVRAAQELGVTRQGLTKLMGRLGITE